MRRHKLAVSLVSGFALAALHAAGGGCAKESVPTTWKELQPLYFQSLDLQNEEMQKALPDYEQRLENVAKGPEWHSDTVTAVQVPRGVDANAVNCRDLQRGTRADGFIDLVFANGGGTNKGNPDSDLPQQAFRNDGGAAMIDWSAAVFAGGLAVLHGIFETLGIECMKVSDGALREGLIFDLLGRVQHEDVRDRSVRALAARFGCDEAQGYHLQNGGVLIKESKRVTIADTHAAALPAGWGGYGAETEFGEPILPAGTTFADVLRGVDEITFTTAVPGWFYGFTYFDVSLDNIGVSAVPEPATWALQGLGLAALLPLLRRRRRARA